VPILNYTTKVSVSKTVSEIQGILVKHGVTGIYAEYQGKSATPVGFSFKVKTAHGERPFKLPANVAGVERILLELRRRHKIPPSMATREHAERVAWRILKDWLVVQLALVDVGLAPIDEVLLPWLHLKGDRTLYQVMSENRLSLPGPGE
jgi:hypothetical protein